MSETTPPPGGQPPPRRPAQPYPGEAYPQREGRPVSFYLAIFLALLLFVSGGLNLLLLVVSAFGSATAGLGGAVVDDGTYETVVVEGDLEAEERFLRISIEGAIAEAAAPLIGAAGGSVSDVRRGLKLAARDDRIKGILLDINSPGGGVTDSDLIWQAITEFQQEHGKPVVALLGDIAASGGYYVAAPCDRILARPTSITGSIGVILSNLNLAKAAENVGVRMESVMSDRTPYKDIMSPWRPMSDAERTILKSIVDEMYDRFVDIVAQGRSDLSRERVVEIADGRIYSAQQALAIGLVDAIGGTDEARAVLEELAGIETAQLVEQRRRPTLTDMLFGMRASAPSIETSIARLLEQSSGARLMYYWAGGR